MILVVKDKISWLWKIMEKSLNFIAQFITRALGAVKLAFWGW